MPGCVTEERLSMGELEATSAGANHLSQHAPGSPNRRRAVKDRGVPVRYGLIASEQVTQRGEAKASILLQSKDAFTNKKSHEPAQAAPVAGSRLSERLE
jgi:hypothetical protein